MPPRSARRKSSKLKEITSFSESLSSEHSGHLHVKSSGKIMTVLNED